MGTAFRIGTSSMGQGFEANELLRVNVMNAVRRRQAPSTPHLTLVQQTDQNSQQSRWIPVSDH